MKTKSSRNQKVRPPDRRDFRTRPKNAGNFLVNGSTELSLKVKRILVPTDFSAPSLKALRYAVRFARQMGATIHLIYILEEPAFIHDIETFPLAIPERSAVKSARAKLIKLAECQIDGLAPVKAQVRIGKPSREIVALARQKGSDLIIIATHGRTGLSRILLGSTTELVVRHAPCPVLVVPGGET